MKSKLEYIWIDGTEPTHQLRSKTKVVSDFKQNIGDCPEWNFDGSSTNQADGHNSDCILKPVRYGMWMVIHIQLIIGGS